MRLGSNSGPLFYSETRGGAGGYKTEQIQSDRQKTKNGVFWHDKDISTALFKALSLLISKLFCKTSGGRVSV